MRYQGRSNFHRIPYMTSNERMTQSGNEDQMSFIDDLLYCACPSYERGLIVEGNYGEGEDGPGNTGAGPVMAKGSNGLWECQLHIMPKRGNGNKTLMGFLGGQLFDFSGEKQVVIEDIDASDLLSRWTDIDSGMEEYTSENPNATDSEKEEHLQSLYSQKGVIGNVFLHMVNDISAICYSGGIGQDNSYSYPYNASTDILLCQLIFNATREEEGGEISVTATVAAVDAETIDPKGLSNHVLKTTDPHGSAMAQTSLSVTSSLEVQGRQVYGVEYGSYQTSGSAAQHLVPIDSGVEVKFVTAYPENVSAGVIAWQITSSGVVFTNSGGSGIKVNYRLEEIGSFVTAAEEESGDGD